jgi:hypothetical protein
MKLFATRILTLGGRLKPGKDWVHLLPVTIIKSSQSAAQLTLPPGGEEHIVIVGYPDIALVPIHSLAFAFILKHDLCPLTSAVFKKYNPERFTNPLEDHVFCPSFINRMLLLEPNDSGMCGFVCLQLFSLFLGTNLLRCEAMQHFIGDKTKQRLDRDFFLLLPLKHMRKFLVGEMEKDRKETTPYFPNSPIVQSMFRYPGLTEQEWKDLVNDAMEIQVRCIFDPDEDNNLSPVRKNPQSPVRKRGIRSTEAVLNRAQWKKPIPLPLPPKALNEYEEQCVLTEFPHPAAEQDVQNLIKTGKCILCSQMLSQDEKDLFRYLARAEAGKLSPKQKKLLADHATKAHPTPLGSGERHVESGKEAVNKLRRYQRRTK